MGYEHEATNRSFVNFNFACQLIAAVNPTLSDFLRKHPSSLLCDAQIAVQLHARHAFEADGHDIHCYHPLLQSNLAGLHHRASFDAEILTAFATMIGHWNFVFDGLCFELAAMGAKSLTTRPPDVLKPFGA